MTRDDAGRRGRANTGRAAGSALGRGTGTSKGSLPDPTAEIAEIEALLARAARAGRDPGGPDAASEALTASAAPASPDMPDAHFGAPDAGALEPSPELLARVLADAEAARPGARPHAPVIPAEAGTSRPAQGHDRRPAETRTMARPARPAARGREALRALGGWPSLGGMLAAGLAGLWIGWAAPSALSGSAGPLLAALVPGSVTDQGADTSAEDLAEADSWSLDPGAALDYELALGGPMEAER